MDRALVFGLLTLANALHIDTERDGPEDGLSENCVDVSIYGPLEFEKESSEVCSFELRKTCTSKSEEVCVDVPATKCEVVTFTDCKTEEKTMQVRDDSVEMAEFLQQVCEVKSERKQMMSEVQKIPVCKNVTRQLCITKWVVNEDGEKIWNGNDECKDVAWEDCTLEEAVFTHEVEVWDCHSSTEPIMYENPTERISSASTKTRVCEPKAVPLCNQTIEQKCETIEWEDCRDEIVPICSTVTIRTPFQEFHHRQHCSMANKE